MTAFSPDAANPDQEETASVPPVESDAELSSRDEGAEDGDSLVEETLVEEIVATDDNGDQVVEEIVVDRFVATDAEGDEVVDEIVTAEVVVTDADGEVLADEVVIEETVIVDGEVVADEVETIDLTSDDAVEVIDEDGLLEEQEPPPESPYDRPGRWYVVHTQSGYEKKVKQNLEARIQSMNMEERIYEVVIPMEDVVEFKQGKKQVVSKKMFPGYLLVRCQLDDDSWYVVRNTPGVTGFVGQGAKPSPLPRRDVEAFLQLKPEGEEVTPKRGKPRLEYEMGETVRVKEGPFADFSGEVIELNEDQLKVKVLVNIFGRETPVELEFSQVAKL
jgi:transcription termination/antitermination protein NusG